MNTMYCLYRRIIFPALMPRFRNSSFIISNMVDSPQRRTPEQFNGEGDSITILFKDAAVNPMGQTRDLKVTFTVLSIRATNSGDVQRSTVFVDNALRSDQYTINDTGSGPALKMAYGGIEIQVTHEIVDAKDGEIIPFSMKDVDTGYKYQEGCASRVRTLPAPRPGTASASTWCWAARPSGPWWRATTTPPPARKGAPLTPPAR